MSGFVDNKAEEEDEKGQRVDSEDSENDDDIPDEYDKNDGFLVDEPDEDEEEVTDRSRKRERKKGESGEERPKKKQRKRLRKNKEKSEELTNELSELLQDQQQLASKSSKNRGAASAGGDEELAFDQEEEEETETKKKRRDVYDDGFIVGSKKRGGGYMDDDNNEDLFGEYNNEDDMDYEEEASSASRKRQTVELQKLYGFEELKELYMTEEDEEIRKEDVPERILLRNKVRAVSEEDIKKEAEWIYEQAFRTRTEDEAAKKPAAASENSGWDFEEEQQPQTTSATQSVETLKANCVAAIEKILSFLHKAHFDIPFISHYRKEQFVPTLENDDDLWTIFELDEKWAALQAKIQQVKDLYAKSVIDHQYHQLLQSASSMEEVNDLLTHYHAQQAKLTTAPEPATKRPSRKDLYAVAKRNNLQSFAPTFGLSSSQFAENVSSTFTSHKVVDHTQDPDVAALDLRSKELRTTEQVLKATRHMIALDIANEPVIRQKVRLVYELFATLTTKLTPKGESSSIEALKGLILNKAALSTFKTDPEKCIRFVSILKANRDGLLEIHVDIDEDQIDSALDYRRLFLSDKTSSTAQAWNKQREMIITQVKQILKPSMSLYARSFYSKEANKIILKAAEKKLEAMLMAGPLGHKKKKINSDDDDKRDERSAHIVPHRAKILACTPPVGTEPTAFALLDMDGNLEESFLWRVSPYQDVTGGVKIEKKERNERFKYPSQHATQTQQLLEFVRTHRPQAIAISTTTTNAVQLRDIMEETLGTTIPIYYVQDNVARVFEVSEKAQKEFADTPIPVRRAISIGRRLRDPMIEIANLYNEKNDILCLKLHPLQDMLDKDELLRHLERVFVRVVNKVGVDINKIVMHPHMQNQLRFVGGLGPRKAQYLIKSILAVTGQYINKRKALHESVLGSSVLLNCAGFLKIIPPEKENVDDSDVLENTRIHPESYELAVKMSVDALEDEDNKEDINSSVELVMKEPEKLEDLDLDAYADELEKRKLGKKHITLKDIRNELENPFGDPRDNFREMSDVDLFYAVTGENEFTFHVNMVVTVYVYKKLASGAECKLENGIHGRIPKEDLDNIQEGSYAEAKIQQIDFTHLDVTLSANRSEVEKHKEAEPAKPIPKKKAKPRIQRNINHSCYKNMIYPEAIAYLRDKEPGELVIRPSSKGENHLTITFKFFGDTYINLDVKEEKKVDRFSLGKELYVSGKKYDDLDEVCFRCVQNVIEHAKALTQNPKFTDKRPEEIEQVLLKEKQTNPNGIPYRIGLNKDYPGRFFIHYLPGKKVRREVVTVTPDGYSFFKRIFSNPTKLINAFKRSYKEGSNKSSSSSSSSHHQSHSHSQSSSSSYQPRRSPPPVAAPVQAAAASDDGWDI